MNPSFPLLHLPESILSHVLKNMEVNSLFGLSLVSRKAKNLVKSMNVRASDNIVMIGEDVFFCLFFPGKGYRYWNFYKELGDFQENEEPRSFEKPPFIYMNCHSRGPIQKWENKDYELKDLFDHLQAIFHVGKIILMCKNNAQRFDIESIYKTTRNVKKLNLLSSQSHDFNNRVLKRFELVKDLDISYGVFENQKVPERILIHNYDCLKISAGNLKVTLNDLLSANSKELLLFTVEFSNEIINKFLKCWMKGSNSRLESIHFSTPPGFIYNKDAILKGLKYGTIPNEERKRFKFSVAPKYTTIVQGGFSIQRKDGTTATINIGHNTNVHRFDMFIWHD